MAVLLSNAVIGWHGRLPDMPKGISVQSHSARKSVRQRTDGVLVGALCSMWRQVGTPPPHWLARSAVALPTNLNQK